MRNHVVGLAVCAAACGVVFFGTGRPPEPPTPPGVEVVVEPPAEVTAVAGRSAAKERLFSALIAGTLRLADAVAAVLDLNRDWPPLPPDRYDAVPGDSLRERVGRSLVGGVELRLAGDDSGRDAVLVRLAGELAAIAARPRDPTDAVVAAAE